MNPAFFRTCFLLAAVILAAGISAAYAGGSGIRGADELFTRFQEQVVQIRVIDNSSGKKSAIGSGFAVGARGQFATNFHVLAEAVNKPGRYRLEYLDAARRSHPLTILDIDVVHDLAVVKAESAPESFFLLADRKLSKGSRIYAMGNPLDLGMTIVEGTFNGLVEESLYEKILFSGSLNPGMSGGPAIDAYGRVIGVSVSTAGNAISFLVPSSRLQSLLDAIERRRETGDTVDFLKRIDQELFENQKNYMERLMALEWKKDTLGRCLVPREMGTIFKCWGESLHDQETLYRVSRTSCANNDYIFLSPELSTGSIAFSYLWYEADRLGPLRFYRMLQNRFGQITIPNYAAKEDLEKPNTTTRFVRINGADWKTTMCTWQYKKYPRIHDVVLKMALVNYSRQSLLVELQLRGVSKSSASAFCQRFMGALQCLD